LKRVSDIDASSCELVFLHRDDPNADKFVEFAAHLSLRAPDGCSHGLLTDPRLLIVIDVSSKTAVYSNAVGTEFGTIVVENGIMGPPPAATAIVSGPVVDSHYSDFFRGFVDDR